MTIPLLRKRLRIFIDESGTPHTFVKGKHQEHDKYFTLAAVIISHAEYQKYKAGIKAIHEKYKEYLHGREIKSNSIRRSNPLYITPGQTPPFTFHEDVDGGRAKYEEFCT